jgi:hypothetical protein
MHARLTYIVGIPGLIVFAAGFPIGIAVFLTKNEEKVR